MFERTVRYRSAQVGQYCAQHPLYIVSGGIWRKQPVSLWLDRGYTDRRDALPVGCDPGYGCLACVGGAEPCGLCVRRGVLFRNHFNLGDIADSEYGAMSATILFAEHPELFDETCMAVPKAYIVELPEEGYYVDINEDGAYESLQMCREVDEVSGEYSGYGIGLYPMADTFESVFAYDYNPF